jgi:spore maturation protein CgeB
VKIVVFGLSVSSSWGNGHATIWRGLLRELGRKGHRTVFFERDEPWYSRHRDFGGLPGLELVLHPGWPAASERAARELADADVGIVTSFCADAVAATDAILAAGIHPVFYDLDTPVTLARLDAGEDVPWVGRHGYSDYSIVLSFTGGASLADLRERLGARRVAPLYGSVDPDVHRPMQRGTFESDLTYLGTYAGDRQAGVDALLVAPARRMPGRRFRLAGAQYPDSIEWPPNVFRQAHLAPADHAAFFASAPLTLNVTRAPMAACGWCPSGRLFEAAASGVPVLSDWFPGLDEFFTPGREILVARGTDDAVAAIDASHAELARIGNAARERALEEHTAERRAGELLALLSLAAGAENDTEEGHDVGDHSGSRDR